MYRIELSIVEERPGARTPITVLPTKYIESSLSLSVEREERAEALAYALDVLGRLSVPLDARPVRVEQEGRTEDAVGDAVNMDSPVRVAEMIAGRLEPLIAEIAVDPGGEWFNGAAPHTMERLRTNILGWLTRAE